MKRSNSESGAHLSVAGSARGVEVSFDLPMPPSVNDMFANGGKFGRRRTKRYKDWSEQAGWMLITQRNRTGRHKRMDGPIEVTVRAYRKNKARDLDNILKALMDLLTNTQTIKDDSQIIAIDARWVDSGVPCTMTVREVDADTPLQVPFQ